MTTPLTTLEKQPSEKRWWAHDFAAKMSAGETITSIASIVIEAMEEGQAVDLVYTTPTIVAGATAIEARYEGGSDGRKYRVTVRVITARAPVGQELELEGFVKVKERQ